jgi:hypothetical protein
MPSLIYNLACAYALGPQGRRVRAPGRLAGMGWLATEQVEGDADPRA